MRFFKPKRVFFEQGALEYPLGEKIYNKFKDEKDIIIKIIGSHNRVTGIPGKTPQEGFREAKKTLVIGVRKSKEFQTCKPSAHYQLPLSTGCPGMCEYCYLHTTLGKKPYLRIYVNIEEILAIAEEYIKKRLPDVTIFEGAATSDPLAVEYLSGSLKKTIEFFKAQSNGRFRFVTKYTDVDSLLEIDHGGHTFFRFSINTPYIINKYEHNTPTLEERLEAVHKVSKAGYFLGFIIGPVILYENWEKDYKNLAVIVRSKLKDYKDTLPFEIITHRFTTRAKNNIENIFPKSTLPLDKKARQTKYGQFGYIKYLYPRSDMNHIKTTFEKILNDYIPNSKIEYFV